MVGGRGAVVDVEDTDGAHDREGNQHHSKHQVFTLGRQGELSVSHLFVIRCLTKGPRMAERRIYFCLRTLK